MRNCLIEMSVVDEVLDFLALGAEGNFRHGLLHPISMHHLLRNRNPAAIFLLFLIFRPGEPPAGFHSLLPRKPLMDFDRYPGWGPPGVQSDRRELT
jgi:hypothetical protein